MRFLFLALSFIIFILMIILFFQNVAAAYPTMMYFLMVDMTVSPAWFMLFTFVLGLFCAGFFFLFLTQGKPEEGEESEIFDGAQEQKSGDEW